MWELKRENKTAIIKWRILRKIHAKPRFNFFEAVFNGKVIYK